jgi:predicted outer membrane repeat protein
MKALKILIVMLILIMSAGAACAAESITDNAIGDDSKEILQTVQEDITTDDSTDILKTTQNDIYTASDDSFTNLTDEINSKEVVDLTHDYKFNNETDAKSGIVIEKDNFVLNGNGRTIDGNNQTRLFSINGNNITFNDLILINGNSENCGGIRVGGALTLNNVTFINNYANKEGGAIGITGGATLICNNCRFIDNYAETGSAIVLMDSKAKIYNSYLTSKIFAKRSQISITSNSEAYIENTTFVNITSSYTPAVYIKSSKASIVNSKFIDLKANITAGAIATKEGGELYIENCEFENVTSSKNGGAIFADVAGENNVAGSVTIIDTKFKDTYSEFGGAYVQLGGDFVLKNTEFINAHAKYNGGAIYLSHTNTEINNSTFDSNGVSIIEGYPTYGGAIFCDKSTLNITESKFFNNVASAGNAIYTYDTSYNIKNSLFENNTNPIYTVFDGESNIDKSNVFVNDDNISTNNTYYATIMIGQGLQLVLLNNTINTTDIPERFDLRDYGWVSSIKDQGWMGACWTFGMTGTLESALLKAANITTDFSENNMQNTMLKYSIYGSPMVEGGINTIATGYLLSWLGAFTLDVDIYDEMGKISPVITTQNDIHIQDVMFTPNNEIPYGTQLKLAIMKYGSIDVSFNGQATYNDVTPYYNPETHAQYAYESIDPNHEVSIIGWDDNFSRENFLIKPDGDGAWIVKNSYGTEWGDNGYLYVSYYDKTLINSKDITNYATSIIIENTEPYNKNYQYDLIWGTDFKSGNQNVSYMNVFEALDDDLIAAVGTYFDKEGNNYTVEIYVNDELKLTQTGVSPYLGYRTIKLNEYIPISEGDVFKAVITSNAAPTLDITEIRPHYTQNLSYISFDGKSWKDAYDLGYIVCLKVYTVAKPTLSGLQEAIANSTENYLDLNVDYEFNNGTDNSTGILISRDNFIINGNGHTIDGKNQSRIFNITANNVTLNDLILINGNAEKGGAIYTTGLLTLNNVTFIDNYVSKSGGAVALYDDVTLNCNNSQFIDNYAAEGGSSIVNAKGEVNLYNAYITSKVYAKAGQVMGANGARFYLENITFANTTATYSPAIYLVGSKARIIDSRFINLNANLTAGAMSLREGGELYIKNCEFTNTTSTRNAGAVYVDITGYNPGNEGNVTIIDSKFKDASSGFAGAYVQLGGQFWLSNTEFTNNHATFNGGVIYLSFTETEISNCTFDSNGACMIENYSTYGGAIFSDISTLNITDSRFFNNVAGEGNAIYAYDSSLTIKGSTFKNNTNAVFSVFTKECNIDASNVLNNDTVSTNNTFYATIMVGEGMQLTLVNNTINVDTLPARFDLRDWGWVSTVRDQGWMGACWTFGMSGALESALLKATGIPFNVSMNNMKTVMKYSPYGAMEIFEGGANLASAGYLLSWLGAIPYDVETYDELGKITMPIKTDQNIHIQDVIFIPNSEIPNGTQMKLAIMKYGSLDVSFFGQSTFDEENPYYNPETYAQYADVPEAANHEVSIIGWDDNFPKEKFLITPPGDGAWIIKNSYGDEWGDNGFLYVSYYDQTLIAYTPGKVTDYAAATIIENTVPYNKNYQYDITWLSNFEPSDGNISYMNVFEALDDDLIAAVGTYFNQSGVNYTVEIYVNDELKLTQTGVSPYVGYHTIKLDSYIPIKKGDVFKAAITSNWVPYLLLEDTRVHYTQNISYVSFDGKTWQDAYDLGYIACLKVYTVADDSKIANNKNIAVDYAGGKYFSVNVVTEDGIAVAGTSVKFNINGVTKTVKTNSKGVAKIKITQTPKKYTIKTTYNGKTVKNTVTVKQVLTASKVTVKKTVKKFTLKAKLKINGKLVKGKKITFKINGKTYKVKTNKNGIAKKTLNKNALKLKKGKKYTVKVTYLKDTIKTTVKIK